MAETTIGSEIKDPNQKFVYLYDFVKNWYFLVELINVSKEENSKLEYPAVVKSESIGPSQYGTRGLIGDKLAEVEEKYDLNKSAEGFSEVGEETGDLDIRRRNGSGRGYFTRIMSPKTVIIISGPTASGKTELALEIASISTLLLFRQTAGSVFGN